MQENALSTLEALILILTPSDLNSLRPKVMSTLKSVVHRYTHLQEIGCKVFLTFVTRLEISNVGPILSQIFVDLLPCLGGKASEQVVEILEYLVVENRKLMKNFIEDIPFVPEDDHLKLIAQVVKEEQGQMDVEQQVSVFSNCEAAIETSFTDPTSDESNGA
jgi:hypothetical protein